MFGVQVLELTNALDTAAYSCVYMTLMLLSFAGAATTRGAVVSLGAVAVVMNVGMVLAYAAGVLYQHRLLPARLRALLRRACLHALSIRRRVVATILPPMILTASSSYRYVRRQLGSQRKGVHGSPGSTGKGSSPASGLQGSPLGTPVDGGRVGARAPLFSRRRNVVHLEEARETDPA